ncbi:MAG: SET domain-containing protein [Bacteroidota bacterium]
MSTRLPFLYIQSTSKKGRGVFTAQKIPAGSHIETCPVLILSKKDTSRIHKTKLHDYYFLWGKKGESAIALGFGSIYNHAKKPNAEYAMDLENNSIDIFAIRKITAGQEITINYMDGGVQESELWFKEK